MKLTTEQHQKIADEAYLDAIGADGMLFVGTKVKGLEMVRREWWCVFQKEEV